MCRFEDVKMCKLNRFIVIAALVLLSTAAHSQTNTWQTQSAIAKNFIKRLETQPLDSLLPFLYVGLKNDSTVKSNITSATAFLSRTNCSCDWLVLRIGDAAYECRYADEKSCYLIVQITFGDGPLYKTISGIKFIDQQTMKNSGIGTDPLPPPPPPPPPPSPRPR